MICIVVFSAMLFVIAASVAITVRQVDQLNAQQEISSRIERGASSLNSVSIEYFLHQEDLQLSRWQSTLSSLSNDLSNLKPNSPQQQTLANNVAEDLRRLNALFDDVVSYLQKASRDVSVRIDPAFQIRWSSMAVQSQALASDASQLSRSLSDQAHQINDTNTLLIVSLVGAFGAFLATIYLMVFRRTLRSVAELQTGINTTGSGNLGYTIKTEGQNEITELSHAFNRMTANLKTMTASKAELEKEVTERKNAENSLQRRKIILEAINEILEAALSSRSEEELGQRSLALAERLTQSKFGFIDEIGTDNLLHSIAISNPGWEACMMTNQAGHVGTAGGFKVHGIYGRVLLNGKGFFTNDPANHPDSIGLPPGHPPLKSFLGVPLILEEKTIGVIAVANREGGYSQHELETLEALAPIIVEAFLRKRAEQKLEHYSKHLKELVEEKTKQLQDTERLAAIGQTAGMVGHDIRNPLQAITSDVYLLEQDLTSMPESEEKKYMLESLQAIGKNVDYINKIVADLQDYAKPLKPTAQETDLEDILDELLLKCDIPENIKTFCQVKKDAKKTTSDPIFLNRILGNLTANAVQAMPDGGNLSIYAYRETSDIVITIEDTGVGIPDETKPKLFTPLFSTKSKGQGFGLAVVKRMTEALNGTVTVESEVGKGTKFTLRLPNPTTQKPPTSQN